jgi:hypothetical protein
MDGSVARFHLMQNDEWRMQNGKETAEAKRRQVAAATKKTKEQKDSRGNGREKAQKEVRLRTACLRRDEEGARWFRVQFWLRPVWSPQRPIYAALRCQLVALATYLPRGYLVAAATYLRFAPVHQASVSASPPVRRLGSQPRVEQVAWGVGPERALKTYRLKNYKLKASSACGGTPAHQDALRFRRMLLARGSLTSL